MPLIRCTLFNNPFSLTRQAMTMLIKPINIISIILIMMLSYSMVAHAATYYVKPGGGSPENGTSWNTAFASLQAAINAAKADGGGDVWVAQGTYTPGSARTDTFQLESGVAIYGGFNPSNPEKEEALEPKDTRSNKTGTTTILSGEINNSSDTSDNICHVVTGSGTGNTAILDSFTISGGNATGCSDENGGGIYSDGGSPKLKKVIIKSNTAANGSGMYNNGAAPRLISVKFQDNTATNDGGGLYNDGSSPILSSSSFTNNTATNDGGGMYNTNDSKPKINGGSFTGNEAKKGGGMYNNASTPTISSNNNSVSFTSNKATAGNGGGIYNQNNSSFELNRVLFKGNSATGDGGGVYNDSTSNTSLVTHAVFSGNKADSKGGGMFSAGSSGTMKQVTFTGNLATADGGGFYNQNSVDSKWTIDNSIFWNNWKGDSSSASDSEIVDNGTGNKKENSSIVDESDSVTELLITTITSDQVPIGTGDFHLKSGSDALDSGDNTLAPGYAAGPPETADVDLDKKTRIIKDTVDMGAYESQAPEVNDIICQTQLNCGDDTTPRNKTMLEFKVTFDEPVKGVEANDFILIAPAGKIFVAGETEITTAGIYLSNSTLSSGTDYTISPDGSSLSQTYTVTINLYTGNDRTLLSDGKLQLNLIDDDGITNNYDIPLGNTGVNTGDFSTGKIYRIDNLPPTVTIEQASTQSDPTTDSPIEFTVVFSELVTGFSDVTLTGAASATTATVTEITPNDGTTYQVSVSGMTSNGAIIATIEANKANDAAGNGNEKSTSTDNQVTYEIDATNLEVTINQADSQADPSNNSTIYFKVVFSENVKGNGEDFTDADVTLGGDAKATTATVTEITPNDGTTYQVAVTGMTDDGTVIASVGANVARDASNNGNEVSTSTDNEVTYQPDVTIPTATITAITPNPRETAVSSINIQFSEAITGFDIADLSLTRDGGTLSLTSDQISSSDNAVWTLNNLSSLTESDGSYLLTLTASGSNIIDAAGNALVENASVSWEKTSPSEPVPTPTVTPTPSPIPTVRLSIEMTGMGGGSVKSNPSGINCHSDNQEDCKERYSINTTVTLTPTAATNSSFTGWSGPSDCEDGKIYINQTMTCKANFDLLPVNLLITREGNGAVTSEPAGIDCDSDNEQCNATFDSGTEVTLTAIPEPGWTLSEWTGECSGKDESHEESMVILDQEQQCQAIFEPLPQFNLFVAKTGSGQVTSSLVSEVTAPVLNIDCGEQCQTTYQAGTEVMLTAIPDPGWQLESWRGHCDETGHVIIAQEYTQCRAIFIQAPPNSDADNTTPSTHARLTIINPGNGTITSQPAGINCGATCEAEFAVNTAITLTALPDEGFALDAWQGDCDALGTVTLNANKQCEAIFLPINRTPFTLNVYKIGEGTITSEPIGINCGDSCIADYDGNQPVKLTAIPDNGWQFDSWRGHCDEQGYVALLYDYDFRQCRAIFTQAPVSITPAEPVDSNAGSTPSTHARLTIINPGNGTITSQPAGINCGTTCEAEFAVNTAITLTAIPDEGFTLDSWQGDCDATVTLNADKQCKAIFLPINRTPFTLNVYKMGEGSITSEPVGIDCGESCVADYDGNQPVKLTATPDNGWQFDSWRGHCDEQGYVALLYDYDFRQCRAIFTQAPVSTTSDDTNAGTTDSGATNSGTSDPTNTSDIANSGTSDSENSNPNNASSQTDSSNNTNTSDNRLDGQEEPASMTPDLMTIGSPENGQSATTPVAPACGDRCTSTELQHAPVKLAATAAPGYSLIGWTGACGSTAETMTISTAIESQCQPVFAPDADNNGIADVIEDIYGQSPANANTGITDTSQIQFSQTHYTVDEFGNVATITVDRQASCQGQIRVDYTTVAGSATQAGLGEPSDYLPTSGSLKWSHGDCQSHYFTIPIQNDNLPEGTETVAIELNLVEGNAKMLTPQAILSIIDDEIVTEQGAQGTENTGNNNPPISETTVTPSVGTSGEEGTTGNQTSTTPSTTTPSPTTPSLTVMLTVNETTQITLNELQGVLLIKQWPNSALVSVDGWQPLNDNEVELTLTGLKVGETQMLISDNLTAQQFLIEITVVPAATVQPNETTQSEEVKVEVGSQYAEFEIFVNVGQTLNYQINAGQGEISVYETPDNRLVTLSDWQPRDDGTVLFTLTGLQAGNTHFLIRDTANPPLYSQINITIVPQPTTVTQTPSQPIEQTTSSNRPIDCLPAQGVGADGLPIENTATTTTCFISKLSSYGKSETNHAIFSPTQAKNIRLSTQVWIAPEHVGKTAEFLIVAIHNADSQLLEFTRDEQQWMPWNKQLNLTSAQYHPQLPQIVDVFIFSGDLSTLPGEYTIYVGYRLDDDTIIYNGSEPLHFFIY